MKRNTSVATKPAAISKAAARKLTNQIKAQAEALWALLLEAHETKAWAALGYPTWNAYIAEEFGMSKAHGFRLVNQGIVIREIEAAAGVTRVRPLTVRATEAIKPNLKVVTDEIKARVAKGENPVHAITETVAKARKLPVKQRVGGIRKLPPAEDACHPNGDNSFNTVVDIIDRWLVQLIADLTTDDEYDVVSQLLGKHINRLNKERGK